MIKNKLSEIMGRKRINIAELARLTGLSRITITGIYKNTSKQVALETLNKICWALDCNVQDIFEYEQEK